MASDRLARLQLSFSVYLVGFDVNISASALLNTNPGLELILGTRAGARLLLTGRPALTFVSADVESCFAARIIESVVHGFFVVLSPALP